jgi:hypothetical protein
MKNLVTILFGALSVFASSTKDVQDSLEAASTAKQLQKQGTKPSQIVFGLTVDENDKIIANRRDTVSFHFKVRPAEKSKETNNKGQLTLLSVLDADSSRGFLLALLVTDKPANVHQVNQIGPAPGTAPKKVDVLLARKEGQDASIPGRAIVAKLWNLVGENIHAKYESAGFESVVLGTGLSQNVDMGTFQNPGSGPWTLLRVYAPAEAFLALNLESGIGQLFPKNPGTPDAVGKALFRLF